MAPLLLPGDVVLTRSGGFVGWAIRLFTRRIGESRTKASHTGVIVESGTLQAAIIVEALSTVKRHPLWDRYARGNHEVAVFRPLNLADAEIAKVVAKAETYVGRSYGYVKIFAHWLDWLLQGAYVFRRLTNQDRYPICSWVVAHAFAAAGKDFGVAAGCATPDDIWDFVTGNPDKYSEIVGLARLTPYNDLAGVRLGDAHVVSDEAASVTLRHDTEQQRLSH
jgi:hypothetical protein